MKHHQAHRRQWSINLLVVLLLVCGLLMAMLSSSHRILYSIHTVSLQGSHVSVSGKATTPAAAAAAAAAQETSRTRPGYAIAISMGQKGTRETQTSSSGLDIGTQKATHGSKLGTLGDTGTNWNYRCWTPHNMSQPSLTIATVMGGLPKTYLSQLRRNRLLYCARHGYRYCELYSSDKHRVPAWSKLPWLLALAPCTDYLFHLDADAMLVDHSQSCKPIMEYMQATNTDQLLPGDIASVPESPLNFGVFMVRPAPWIWSFYQRLYNICPCDWGRMHDWPVEQGLIYDLLASNPSSLETQRSRIVSNAGWNHILVNQDLPSKGDLVVHITWPGRWPPGSDCKYGSNGHRCKYPGLEYFIQEYVNKQHKDYNSSQLLSHFTVSNQTCQPVRASTLFSAHNTYSNLKDKRQETSVMDFDVDPATGEVLGIKVGQVGCLGGRGDSICRMPKLWNGKNRTGPWMPYKHNVMEGAPQQQAGAVRGAAPVRRGLKLHACPHRLWFMCDQKTASTESVYE